MNYVVNRPAGQAVRERAKILASYIDKLSTPSFSALSIACGHLREASFSTTILENKAHLFAMDHDPVSLDEVKRSLPGANITTIKESVFELVRGNKDISSVDFVYSAGLYDYLKPGIAKRLTSYMFKTLNSRGTLLVTNFTPYTPDIGYMESFMGWDLIYRTHEDMLGLLQHINEDEIASTKIFYNKDRSLVFLEVTKT